ncbi:MAG: PhoD-like phosphatase N-terminal domain-containing protein, partial [Perlucidibaca sp.]
MRRRQFIRSGLILGATLPGLVACGGGSTGDAQLPPDAADTMSPAQVDALLAAAAFPYGVASGDPEEDKLILWTALKPVSDAVEQIPVTLEYVVSDQRLEDEADWPALFTAAEPLRLGSFLALKARDYTLKLDLGHVALYQGVSFARGMMTALPAASHVYYRFRAGSQVSRIGRGKTLPAASRSAQSLQ